MASGAARKSSRKAADKPMAAALSTEVATTCPYCGVGCGVISKRGADGAIGVGGDEQHPANLGRLCVKGSALAETIGLETRLLAPMIGDQRSSWEDALDVVADGFKKIRDAHGPQAIAFYLSGQLLTEDYYVANKLAKGFIGTPHVDTNSRLCMSSTVAGHKRAFGEDVVPQCYEDLECADVIVLVGSNAAWCHPIVFQRIQAARKARGTRLVTIDPRRTPTAEDSDQHLAVKPGSDVLLWNGLLVWLAEHGLVDADFVAKHTEGFEATLAAARAEAGSLTAVAEGTGLAVADVEAFYRAWGGGERVVSCFSQGVNQSAQGTDKVNAILNCHLASGRIGREGCGPFSLTGQPNAMGGREVGGLANMLAAHMGFSDGERETVREFWQAPNLVDGEGLKAVAMLEAVEQGKIKALWVMGTNPAVSLPRADAVRKALAKLDLLVVSENVLETDTANAAHVRLPAAAWGEKDGTVTNSERRISRQRAFLPLPGEARPDWWILSEIARRLGWGEQFAYRGAGDIFREHAALSAYRNTGQRLFHLGPLATITDAEYDALEPVQWPVKADGSGTDRLFAEGGFATPTRRAKMVPVVTLAGQRATSDYPFVLNTGRIRDQWHTMTRTGLSGRLNSHLAEPFVEVSSKDAVRLGLREGGLAEVASVHGAVVVRIAVSRGLARGQLFVPIHWTGMNSAAARVGAVVHGVTDPFSGQPDAKATHVNIRPVAVGRYGFLMTRGRSRVPGAAYWTTAVFDGGNVTYFALPQSDVATAAVADVLLPVGDRLTLEDASTRTYRAAVLKDGRLEAVIYVGGEPLAASLEWLKSQFAKDRIEPEARRALLAGRPLTRGADEGAVVCVCKQVGSKRIAAAIAEGACTTEEIGARTKAGTNCGSCLPEIRRMIAAATVPAEVS